MNYNHEVLKRFSINDNILFYIGDTQRLGTVVGYQLTSDRLVELVVKDIGGRFHHTVRPNQTETVNLTTGICNNDLSLI